MGSVSQFFDETPGSETEPLPTELLNGYIRSLLSRPILFGLELPFMLSVIYQLQLSLHSHPLDPQFLPTSLRAVADSLPKNEF